MDKTHLILHPIQTVQRFLRDNGILERIRHYESVIILIVWAGTFATGYFGYVWAFSTLNQPHSVLDTLYMTVQLFFTKYSLDVSPPNFLIQFARFFSPALMFSSIVYLLIRHLIESFRKLYFRFSRGNVIICGLGLLGPVLVDQFCKNWPNVVVIEKEPSSSDVEVCRDAGAFFIQGDATKDHILKAAGIEKARYLITVTGNDEVNAEIAGRAVNLRPSDPIHPLICYLHIVDLNVYTLLKMVEFQKAPISSFRLDIFNIYQAAGGLILDHPQPVFKGATVQTELRFLLIGFGRLGESLICNATKQWKARFVKPTTKLHFTILDRNADERYRLFLLRHPELVSYCEFSLLPMDVSFPEFAEGRFLESRDNTKNYSRIFICLGNPKLGLSAGLIISKKLWELQRLGQKNSIPIIIRTNHEAGLTHYTNTMNVGKEIFSNMYAFSLSDEISKNDTLLNTPREMIARAIHENYVEKEKADGQTLKTNHLLVPWKDLPEDYKESNRLQADDIVQKLKAISCRIVPIGLADDNPFTFWPEEVEILAIMEHDRWMKEKKRAGWKYGNVRREFLFYKRHPLLVPFDELDPKDQEKDRNAVRLIPALLKSVDLKIERVKGLHNL